MSTVVNYKGLSVLVPDPSGDGGALIQTNFKAIADKLEQLFGEVTSITDSDVGGGIDPDSVTTQNVTSDNFTLSHNNKKILNLTSDGNVYGSTSIDPGTTLGQRLLIVALPSTSVNLVIRQSTLNAALNGAWKRNQSDGIFSWLELQWDGFNWNEISRDHNFDTKANGMFAEATGDETLADGYASSARGSSTVAAGDLSEASGDTTTASSRSAHSEGAGSTAAANASHAEGVGTTAGLPPDNFSISGTLVTISGDVRSKYAQSDSLQFYNLSGGVNNTLFSQTSQIADVPAFGGGNTTFNLFSPLDDRTSGTLASVDRGNGAHAEGIGNTASGAASHAEGEGTLAIGDSSHAEGQSTQAQGFISHVEGAGTTAADYAHAEGNNSSADGAYSHSEGSSHAVGDYAHAEGESSTANGNDSHVEGFDTRTGNQARAFSITGVTVTISGDVTFEFTNGHPIRLFGLSGGVNNLLHSVSRSIVSDPAFSGGNTTFDISSGLDDRTSGSCVEMQVGRYGHAEGNQAHAQKESAHAEGESTVAQGLASHAEGSSSLAIGPASHAEGNGVAVGASSHAEGGGGGGKAGGGFVSASAAYSHAEGVNTTAGNTPRSCSISGTTVTIASQNVVREFTNTHTVRFFNLNDGMGGLITADRTISGLTFSGGNTVFTISSPITQNVTSGLCVDPLSGQQAHVEGNESQASGNSSHAEGDTTIAAGAQAHAEGANTIARGTDSHAEGNSTIAEGDHSHVEGTSGRAVGDSSHAEGISYALASISHAESNSSAAGSASHAEASGVVGYAFSNFTLSGTTVTISGNVTAQFRNGDSVVFFDLAGGSNKTLFKATRIISSVAFSGNTTFDIGTPLDDRDSGNCVSLQFGSGAHAEGSGRALGTVAHAEGQGVTAQGDASHAEGTSTQAIGAATHSEGNGTVAAANYSHAEGTASGANGNSSHAEGTSTQANADSSHAEGASSIANGLESHAEGNSSIVGFPPQPFTISGNTITITGVDVTAQFANGDTISLWNLTGGVNNTVFTFTTSITSIPAFSGGDTTFNISSPPDDRTAGTCADVTFGQAAHAEGNQSQATQNASHAQGDSAFAWTHQNMRGMSAHACGAFATPGDAQFLRYILRTATTDASTHQMQDPDNFIMRTGSGYAITATIYAKEDNGGGGGHAMYKRLLIIDTTGFIVEQTIGTDIGTNAGAPPTGWTVAFLNNGSNLQINVNGNGANVHWVAVLELVEINA